MAPMPAERDHPAPPLSVWLGVFAPAYRGRMVGLIALNILSAATVFIELQLLRALTVVLSRVPSPADLSCNVDEWIRSGFSLGEAP